MLGCMKGFGGPVKSIHPHLATSCQIVGTHVYCELLPERRFINGSDYYFYYQKIAASRLFACLCFSIKMTNQFYFFITQTFEDWLPG